ncbi:sin3 complex subunit [Pyrenophora seminiperda CCB06]|uniref:Sin3 complex subunit n=1 Tax=Pyrenophora seminiperda CCB06 TaxID=1302712 RepID=A0A3M7LZ24_9PLEO|nr:sin3 complex subunit [Pyrenophora seminiperda CCB06]
MHTEKELPRQVPSLHTSTDTSSTTQSRPPPPSNPPTAEAMAGDARVKSPTSPAGHQRFVLTDSVAARYIEEDLTTSCHVLARRQKIEGYEIYLVEQWACSRTHPTFLITTYTGNPEDTVLATIISVPRNEEEWSPQMRLYFKSLTDNHARRKETPYGALMITNLSGFPSSLTVIPIPGGDLKTCRESFMVNENLKRLGCSGRLGIKLSPPSGATQAKFHQLYRTSEKIPFNASVIELVKLCQVALVLFGKLEPEYADGLLCDVTEKAINDWWIDFGSEYYTVEPHDGILGPTTVAALLGMLMGARNRLSACGAAVAKDVFDIEATQRGISHFQKSQHLPRTRRLDRHTLEKLRRASAKAASKEGWAVPRAFKSTVAELGGKGGEMVMGIVGAGQKDGIAEVETVDIDQFVELVRGEHAKWLWHGKPRKTISGDSMLDRLAGGEERATSPDKNDHAPKPARRETTEHQGIAKRDTTSLDLKKVETFTPEGIEKESFKDPSSKRAAIKAKLESGSGFHHIKNAVGLRTHASKLSRDDHSRHGLYRTKSGTPQPQYTDSRTSIDYDEGHSDDPYFLMSPHSTANEEPAFAKTLTETPGASVTSLNAHKTTGGHQASNLQASVAESDISDQPERPPTVASSIAGSIYHGVDLNENLPVGQTSAVPPLLRRTQSGDQFDLHQAPRNDDWWPRHLSFSTAEESVLRWPSISPSDDNAKQEVIVPDNTNLVALTARYASQNLHSTQLKRLHNQLLRLSSKDQNWVHSSLSEVLQLSAAVDADIETLESIYYPRLDTYHGLREDTHATVTNNRGQLTASLRELENVRDKLEYEISALRGKVEDIEDVVGEFERQVEFVESRVGELENVLGERETWLRWGFRMLTGLGMPPG